MTVLRSCCQGAQFTRTTHRSCTRRACRLVTRAAETKEEAASTGPSSAPEPSSKPSFTREFTSYGARIVESDGKMTGPEDEKDFWEGENMESMGKFAERYFLPVLVVLGVVCGGIAARSYNDDADVFIAPPSGPEAEVTVIPAGALAPAPIIEQAVPARSPAASQ